MASFSPRIVVVLLALLAWVWACPASSADRLNCTLCGEEIQGEYAHYEGLGWNVCATCSEAPKCKICKLPRAGRHAGEGDYCSRCLADADGCASCGLPIVDRYWTVAGVPGKFCAKCRDDAPECSSCRAPTRDARVIDGRVFCRDCRARAVVEQDYTAIYEAVAARARDKLGFELKKLPHLRVVGPAEINAQRAPQARRDDVCGLYVQGESGEASIHLLSHLPRARTTAVLAHELAHAWQAENCPHEQGLRIREGFAEWVAWKLLEGMEGMEAERAVIAARTDDYGLGFRLFADLERESGAAHALWYAKAARQER